MKKKTIACLLMMMTAMSLLVGCSSGKNGAAGQTGTGQGEQAAAEETAGEENLGEFEAAVVDGRIEMPTFGLALTVPQAWRDAGVEIISKGYVDLDFAYADIRMIDPEDPGNQTLSLAEIYAQREPVDKDELTDGEDFPKDAVVLLGDNRTLYYYSLDYDVINRENPDLIEKAFSETDNTADQMEMLKGLWADTSELLKSAETTELTLPPVPKPEELNTSNIMALSAQDLEGNEMKLGDIIAGNKVTMINVWGTFCGPCVGEMPDLTSLYEQYRERGFGIVGLTVDVLDSNDQVLQDSLEDGRDIVASTGVTYPVLRETRVMKDIFVTSSYPTTYFVDQNGRQIGDTLLGSRAASAWEQIILEKLSEVQ